jgi:hypothetical protein
MVGSGDFPRAGQRGETMDSQWFVARDGDVVGPVTRNEVAAMVAADPDGDLLVWADGFSAWRAPGEVASLLGAGAAAGDATAASAHAPAGHRTSLAERARHEFIAYATIVAYLYVCFGALFLYKTAVLSHAGVSYAPLGVAAIKALVLGKFLLLLHSARIGERVGRKSRPIVAIAWKALLFASLLIGLAVVEEFVVGTIHGKSTELILSELADGNLMEAAVTGVLMVLVLTPYFAMREINSELGDGVLFRMLLTPRQGR